MKAGSAPFARKRFGQHFLERRWVEKVIAAIDPRASDVFLEIGPGRGALTRPLAARARHVVACEIDRDLAAALRRESPSNVTVVEGDFLDDAVSSRAIDAARTAASASEDTRTSPRIRVAGNLPYNVASPILFRLVDLARAGAPLGEAMVMLQREVADRLLAEPGTKDYGVLTILIRHSADVKRVMNLPPGAFRPVPKVQSAIVRLTFHPPDPPVRDHAAFIRLVQTVFTRRRKTMSNAILAWSGSRAPLLPGWLDGTRRPETLTIAEFARLADALVG